MIAGEYGIVFRLETSFNIASFSSLSLKFTKPDGTILTVTNPAVSVGGSSSTQALYTFQNGDVTLPGNWQAQLTYQDATPRQLISQRANFTIQAP